MFEGLLKVIGVVCFLVQSFLPSTALDVPMYNNKITIPKEMPNYFVSAYTDKGGAHRKKEKSLLSPSSCI